MRKLRSKSASLLPAEEKQPIISESRGKGGQTPRSDTS